VVGNRYLKSIAVLGTGTLSTMVFGAVLFKKINNYYFNCNND